jgi:aspartyl/asparaginyl-tRNA synthetase
MQSKARLLTLTLWLTLTLIACDLANRATTTRIKDILDHPRNFENKEVTIYGTVIGGASLVVTKYFELQDDSGSIKVVTDRVLPKKGEKLRVTGQMESIELGSERLIVIREKKEKTS